MLLGFYNCLVFDCGMSVVLMKNDDQGHREFPGIADPKNSRREFPGISEILAGVTGNFASFVFFPIFIVDYDIFSV